MDKFMTMKEVGAYLRLSTQSVKRLIEDGRLAAHKIGRCSYRIPESAVSALLTQTQAKAFINAFETVLEEQRKEIP